MTQAVGTFDSYAAKGNREDLEDKIAMVSPESTPVYSAGFKRSASNKLHEWQRDTLATPNKDNAVIEGDDRTGATLTATTRVGNYTQLFDKTVVVSSGQEAHDKAGRSSEMKYQVAKAFKEIKRDLEAMLLSKNPAVAGSSSVARKSGGLGVLLYSNAQHGGAGATIAHTSGAPTTAVTAGTNRTFTEAILKTGLQAVYAASGEMPSFISVTPSHKATFSGFTGIAVNRYQVAKGKQGVIVGGADVYMSDFGELTIVPNYVQATAASDVAYVLNPETYGVANFQGFKSVPLAKTGHTEKELVSVELAAVATAEAANCKIDNLTP